MSEAGIALVSAALGAIAGFKLRDRIERRALRSWLDGVWQTGEISPGAWEEFRRASSAYKRSLGRGA